MSTHLQHDLDQGLADAAAAAAAAEEQHAATQAAVFSNKWSKNGYGAPIVKQSGKFSREESELVRSAVEEYCRSKQITTARLCSECDHKAELKGAWMDIAKSLPHRSVQSVYRHGIRQLHPFKRGTWSDAECEELVELVTRLGKKWATIQNKLHRSADSCRDKYREMSDQYVRGRWKESETEQLQALIREHLQVDPATDIRLIGRMVEEQGISIPWSLISKKMVKRSRLSCFKKWQKMTGLYSSSETTEDPILAPPTKRQRVEKALLAAETAGAAAAAALGSDYDEIYNAKMADETVQAVDLPDNL